MSTRTLAAASALRRQVLGEIGGGGRSAAASMRRLSPQAAASSLSGRAFAATPSSFDAAPFGSVPRGARHVSITSSSYYCSRRAVSPPAAATLAGARFLTDKAHVSSAAAAYGQHKKRAGEEEHHYGRDNGNVNCHQECAEEGGGIEQCPEERAALDRAARDAFDVMDANRDGTLCIDEVVRAMKILKEGGYVVDGCDREAAERLLRRVDADGDGKISPEEFASMVGQVRAAPQLDRIAEEEEEGEGEAGVLLAERLTTHLRRRRTPTLEVARSMPLSCREMDNTSLMCLAALDVVEARAEVLRRHIMDVDSVPYEQACRKYQEIKEFNRRGLFFHTIPYKVGVVTFALAAFASVPLVFHLPSVSYFNEHFVTADVPEPKDLETWLEVGSWSWNWMEPPLGQVSFAILCLQFARNRLDNIGIRPYTAMIKAKRAQRLCRAFPRYDAEVLSAYSKSVSYYG